MIPLEMTSVSRTRGRGAHAVQAVRNITLRVDPGEVVLLRGPSGSGKTTLLALAAGLLAADAGTVTVAGLRLDRATESVRRQLRQRAVGLVFQRGGLASHLSARDNVRLMAELAGQPARESRRQADLLLESLGVGHRAAQRPQELSGGEEMRVAVARALVHRPMLVLADEPTANLDSVSGAQVAECLARAAKLQGAAVVIATHDDRLLRIADRDLGLTDGVLGVPLPLSYG